jgi:Phytanoyl-CoA dioxygenase (PhyH)
VLGGGAKLETAAGIVMTANLLEAKQQWEDEGWCVIEGVLSDEDIRAAQAILPDLFPTAEDFALDRDPERNRPFHIDSHSVMPNFPFESGALNHLVLHDRIIDLAQDFLGLTDIRLYQGMVSAKYSGGALDDEQLLHVDYGNHTLVVPRPEVGYQQFEMFIYLSDVTPGTAATRMVSRHLTTDIPTERTYLSSSEYASLYEAEVPASGPAGAILCYRPDVYHRGVRMTDPGAARFMLHVSYKPVNTDWLGSSGAWPGAAESIAWHRFMQHTNVRQLSMLGFPEPGHPYWTETTLRGVAARYPLLDLTPWRDAMPDAVPQ